MNPKKQVYKYLFFDFLAAALAWGGFYYFRKKIIESEIYGIDIPFEINTNFLVGITCIPIFWISISSISGYYNAIFRKSRLKEFIQTFIISLIGTVIIFFTLILNDFIISYKTYYQSFFVLFGLQFTLTETFRFILTSQVARKIHRKEFGFNTLIVGSGQEALDIYNEIEQLPKSPGNLFAGFISLSDTEPHLIGEKLERLGDIKEIQKVIYNYQIEEVIIALSSEDHEKLKEIINQLSGLNVLIKVIPDMYDILSGSVKMNSIFGAPLIEISFNIMPVWQQYAKRAIDISVSCLVLIIGSPVFIFTAIMVRSSSPGPIFFKQERIGIHGSPFYIIKFRSMYIDAEKKGPQLSSAHDPRITPWGRIMRKTRLDEIPQFYNVLIGEMSLVGPRPERQFFIDQIVQKAPHYNHLNKVKPGITSWGQVKYGYAENVDEMIQRLKFDLIYLENMSLLVDFKIMIYTILIVFQGRGK